MGTRVLQLARPVMIDVSAWSGLELVERVEEGNRNEVWRGELHGDPVAVRRSRRGPESLRWELDLIAMLAEQGFLVPTVVSTDDGRRCGDSIVVQNWIVGRSPACEADWQLVADELQRLHAVTRGHEQRPGCCTVIELGERRTSVDADLNAMPAEAAALVQRIFGSFAGLATSVIHGDVGASNLRITPDGCVGLLDWDESRVDVTWHDLSPLGVQVLADADHLAAVQLSHAWEAANGWLKEPAYARRRLASLSF